ncbi:MAG: XdhC family protein [Desulfovibrio sp.]|jgi:xanthine dehydrogenase accessory factor|nr:XdhC family protein [Desulfovibrio sp.]
MAMPDAGLLEERIARLLGGREPPMLLTVVGTEGVVPRTVGTRAILAGDVLQESLGGGLFEAAVLEQARPARKEGRSLVVRAGRDCGSDAAFKGGSLLVLCESLRPEQAEVFALAGRMRHEGIQGLWTVDMTDASRPGRKLHVPASMPGTDALPADALADLVGELRDGDVPAYDEGVRCYVEPLEPVPVLLLCGAGHVAREVADLASGVGFDVDVVDERQEFADPARFPGARRCIALPGFEGLVEAMGIGRRHFVAIMTGDADSDGKCLAQTVASRARYVGMLGSRGKRESMFARLREGGVPDAELAAVCCPIGLGIGAVTPREIAVAIVAELLAARSGGGKLQRLRVED